MSALPLDIAAAARPAIVMSVEDSAVRDRFPSARDGQRTPAAGYFDVAADCSSNLVARAALIGVVRRRFVARVQDLLEPDFTAGIPCWRTIDAEQALDATLLTARLEIDFENETSALELFG